MRNLGARTPWRREVGAAVAALLALALLPLAVTDSYSRHILILVFVYAAVAASWDLTLGYGGIFNFGHLAFFGVGLYGYGVLTTAAGVAPWPAFGLATLLSAASAALVSVPILRLKGIYIVLVTFGFSQLIMQVVISQSGLTGGTEGLVRIPSLPVGDHNFVRDGRWGHYYMALALLALAVAGLRAYARSRLGLGLVALKDAEEFAAGRGVSAAHHRILALSFSAVVAGATGAFYGSYIRTASVDVFGMGITSLILGMVLLGGAGTTYGPVVAAFLLTLLSEALAGSGAYRPMIVAVVIVLVMLVAPGGLVGLGRAASEALSRDRSSKKGTLVGPGAPDRDVNRQARDP